ncbi:putative toxin-antitoxin system toxin component, PIN family [Candidatus Roizmanbacteria bacterium CG_4_9_14_3_um_filter_33_18]|uniref:Putative toxin-antitoxin system toxin component, PIN family n=3 Tax=Candidatus Roizmaniibacteriota TaxID=1752723 RepID=A0A2M7UAR6_9BACT|nr:MAG: putative toxin-antitoxin system toxin component, PIN family [Candidatus Roizmanbacteria bacterium CG22_combo_CG10-13_8_21_14_all_34_12]PIZ68313.1 MAG: putative toxin-antitoxin system toxin component, PIN family [Candidatus Roizmanbacteria bacterium CG_4_10_14_0_2_um_filter_33_96]PJA55263.1 MAG: putative toxin-antitoxin system toxin component, PIN family [Candidatus Roizmanbacteria bacterium CG_4_9_14_3_um_filter_33_18]
MIKVVLDTNIIVSAIVFGGKPRDIIYLIQEGKVQAFVSSFILYELKEVLTKKFNFNDEKLSEVEDLINKNFVSVSPKDSLKMIKSYPIDNKILEVAVESKADYLITGDKKHILPLKKIRKTKIVLAEEFLLTIKKGRSL